MLELDRIFDRDDVPRFVAIDRADHRGESGGLAGTGRAADQHQAARRLHQLGENWRQAKLRNRRNGSRQRADGGGQRAALTMDVDAESPRAPLIALDGRGQTQREIDRALFKHPLPDARRHERIEERRDIIAGKGIAVGAQEASADAEHRRRAGDEQQIARTAPRHIDEQRLQRISARHLRRRPRRACSLDGRLAFIQFADELFQLGIGDQSRHVSQNTNEACQK